MQSVRAIANCSYVLGDITAKCGVVILNRASGRWQQTVIITDTSAVAQQNVAFVVDSMAAGWTLFNGDGETSEMQPAGSRYKNIGTLAH